MKYLRVILDKKITFNLYIKIQINKARGVKQNLYLNLSNLRRTNTINLTTHKTVIRPIFTNVAKT